MAFQIIAEPQLKPQGLNSNLSTLHHQFVREKRIIGGVHAKENEYPWAVSVQLTKNLGFFSYFKRGYVHVCSGALIDHEWIITAAHCVGKSRKPNPRYKDLSNWRIRIGSLYRDATLWESFKGWFSAAYNYIFDHTKLEPYYGVKKIIVHPDFDSAEDDWSHDVALLRLDHRISISNMPSFNKLRLPPRPSVEGWPKLGQICTAVGWGCFMNKGVMAARLHAVKLPIINSSVCGELFKSESAAYELCAGQMGEMKGICTGDSGGALVCPGVDGTETLAGVVNYGASSSGEYPGSFARVSNYTKWIAFMFEVEKMEQLSILSVA